MARNFEKVIIDYAEAKNVENSSCDRNGSWIQNWEQVTGRRARKCSFFGCGNDATVGGHLWIKNKPKTHFYIAPICFYCNNSDSYYYQEMKIDVAYLKTSVNPCIFD